MKYLSLFKMPIAVKITGRSSSITNAFINSIIPVIHPTEEHVREALSVLRMTNDNFSCCYCGAVASEWDHLRPLVLNKQPTGFISEIQNLVPSCGKCNQSKGNKFWRDWMFSDAKLSPKTKNVADIQTRAKNLEAYEKWMPATRLDFANIVGESVWTKHQQNLKEIQELMRKSQALGEKVKMAIAAAHAESKDDL